MKILAFVISVCLMLSLVACGAEKPAPQQPQETQGTVETTVAILPENTEDQGPNENQCAGDPTEPVEETDHPTDPEETEAEEAPVEEETLEENSGVEVEEGDIAIPLD